MLIVVNNVHLNNNRKNGNDTYILSDAMPVIFQGRLGGTVRTLVQGAGLIDFAAAVCGVRSGVKSKNSKR